MWPLKSMKVANRPSRARRPVVFGANADIHNVLADPKSTIPPMFEPASSVSVSAAPDNLIAVPPVPVIVPDS